MKPKEITKRQEGARAASSPTAAGGTPSADSESGSADAGEWLSGLFRAVNLEQLLDKTIWSADRPDVYACIAPAERELVFTYFKKFDAQLERTALFHLRHCRRCHEDVKAMLHPGGHASQENHLHGRTEEGIEKSTEAKVTRKARYRQAGGGD